MSKITLTLVVHFKSSKNLNDMAKVAKKMKKPPLLVEKFSCRTSSMLFWAM